MDTPKNSCGAFVESVMRNINGRLDRTQSPRLHNGQYNRVYEAVLEEYEKHRRKERVAALREVKEDLFVWHRKELSTLLGGSETARAVTRIMVEYLRRIEDMITAALREEEGK